jgi:hypothetical protein
MNSRVRDLQVDEDADLYELIYNCVPYFSEFLTFKEKSRRNYEVPYLRFYRSGKLIEVSNYLTERRLKIIIGGAYRTARKDKD